MIIETALLILIIIALKSTLGLPASWALESLFLEESLLYLFSIPSFFKKFYFNSGSNDFIALYKRSVI